MSDEIIWANARRKISLCPSNFKPATAPAASVGPSIPSVPMLKKVTLNFSKSGGTSTPAAESIIADKTIS